MAHDSFVTTTRGLDRSLPPMRLYEKAKKLDVWNPSDIDLSKDKTDWAALAESEKDLILRLLAMFVAREEAVTLDLLPLIQVIAREGRLEEEMFLTTFLFEEAKHTDFFRMPGLRKGNALLKQDESRHIPYGIYLLSRLVAEHPDLWERFESQMNGLLPFAIGVIGDAFGAYEIVPFGLVEDDFVTYAMAQFSKRYERLEKARGQSLHELNRTTKQIIEAEDA